MNILYIIHDNKKGGAAVSFLEMIAAVQQYHKVYVITPHKAGFIPEQLDAMNIEHRCAHYFWWKVAVPHNKILAFFKKNIYVGLNKINLIEAWRMKRFIMRSNIDIIHSNSSVINFGAILANRMKLPHIWHLREFGEEDFNLKLVVTNKKYLNQMRNYATKYVAISNAIKEKYSQILDSRKVIQISNSISDKYIFEKQFTEDIPKPVVFLIAANYCAEKGQIDAVRASLELIKRGISNFKLLLAGNGDFSECKKIVEKNDIYGNIVFLGRVNDMASLRRTTDVEIVGSKCEAFGRVTVEAMKSSNPVIGTKSGGTIELIKESYNGYLYEFGNYMELAENMMKFINDRKLVHTLGKNAFRDMRKRFLAEDNTSQIINLYNNVVGDNG